MIGMSQARRRDFPLLIYDGDCSFCKFWIEYWKSVTEARISYAPYQEVAGEFPQIPVSTFQAAVQLVDPDGTVFSGAEAVFRSLAAAPEKRWLIWCYTHLPGFRGASNRVYGFVARHRGAFYRFTRVLWGDHLERPCHTLTRSLFVRLLGLTYLIAFWSWFIQVRGLIGSDGILPADRFLQAVHADMGSKAYFLLPTLAWLHPSEWFVLLLTGAGIVCAVPLALGFASVPNLFLLWLLYLSQVSIGRDFMEFQWDILLLEAGFLSIFFVSGRSISGRPALRPSVAIIWLFRWLVFRVFFLSGLVKLLSRDVSWRNLTALSFHYETQPIPNFVAWYMYQMPMWFHKFSTAAVLLVELAAPFLIFGPRRFRIGAAYVLVLLQVLILLTGNYCFFNLLTIVLCLTLFDDAFWKNLLPRAVSNYLSTPTADQSRTPSKRFALAALALVLLAVSLIQIALRIGLEVPHEWVRLTRPLEPYYITNTYGLFAVMTTRRPEIVIEGSNNGREWATYEFKYKAGDLHRMPPWVAPYQPRLDWQMWFAALSNYRNDPWFVDLVIRLLQGSRPVLGLLEKNPFPDHPPRYIRAILYDYRFTSPKERRSSGNWWARAYSGIYLPPVSLK